jgi:hypothetical protein
MGPYRPFLRTLNSGMRWIEIVEAGSDWEARAQRQAKDAVRGRKLRDDIAQTERKKGEAARKYQDALRTLNSRLAAKRSDLSSL